jgi:rod shape-determining protein MreC
MESFLGRYRNLTILVGVLFLQLLGLAVQVKRSSDPENTRLIRIWAVDAITPFERVLVWVQTGSGNLWHNYFYLRGVRAENRQLRQELDQMRLDQVRLSEDAEQAHRLQKLLAFKEQVIGKPLAAQVIGTSGNDLSQSIYIDKGSNEGVKPDMAVITSGGIVGKVLHVYPTTAQVLMINDQTSGVGAMLEKTRVQGVLKGTPDGSVVLERVMGDEKVSPGDTILSSGGDQIFPKGLPAGTVTKVSPGHEMFLNIQVKPAADLSRLEEVLVVTERQQRQVAVEDSGRVRAADILAQRLPSVPDRAAVAAAAPISGAKTTSGQNGSAGSGLPATGSGAAKPQIVSNPAAGASTSPALGSGKVTTPGGTVADASGTHNGSVAGQASGGQTTKKSATNTTASAPASNVSPAKSTDTSSASSSAKPIAVPPKPGNQQSKSSPPAPQPPAAEADPH